MSGESGRIEKGDLVIVVAPSRCVGGDHGIGTTFGRGHAGASHRHPEMTAAMESSYIKGKELNRVGV